MPQALKSHSHTQVGRIPFSHFESSKSNLQLVDPCFKELGHWCGIIPSGYSKGCTLNMQQLLLHSTQFTQFNRESSTVCSVLVGHQLSCCQPTLKVSHPIDSCLVDRRHTSLLGGLHIWLRQNFHILLPPPPTLLSTEMRFNLFLWLGEISSCSCWTVLPGPAWVLLNKICKD